MERNQPAHEHTHERKQWLRSGKQTCYSRRFPAADFGKLGGKKPAQIGAWFRDETHKEEIQTRSLKLRAVVGLIVVLAGSAAYATSISNVDFTPSGTVNQATGTTVIYNVKFTGTITPADRLRGAFRFNIVEVDPVNDDELIEVRVACLLLANLPGTPITFDVDFELNCDTKCNISGGSITSLIATDPAGAICWDASSTPGRDDGVTLTTVTNPDYSGDYDGCGDLAVENADNKSNGSFAVIGGVTQSLEVCCVVPKLPTLTQWGLIALGLLLAASLAFVIHRRFRIRPAGA